MRKSLLISLLFLSSVSYSQTIVQQYTSGKAVVADSVTNFNQLIHKWTMGGRYDDLWNFTLNVYDTLLSSATGVTGQRLADSMLLVVHYIDSLNKYVTPHQAQTIYQPILGFTPVPNSRTLSINGTSYDLTANRSWSIYSDSSIYATVYRNDTSNRSKVNKIDSGINGGYMPFHMLNPAGNAGKYPVSTGTGYTFASPTTYIGTLTSINNSVVFSPIGGSNTTVDISVDSNRVPYWVDTLSGNRRFVTPTYLSSFGYGTGTVTKDSAGYGLLGGNVITSGFKSVDTSKISTKGYRQKGIDSITSIGYLTTAVTSVTTNPTNGVTASVSNSTTTPNISIGLGAITPISTNGLVIVSVSSPTLTVTGSSSVSGANTGDQIAGYGLSGTSTLLVDTSKISTKGYRQKGIDSITSISTSINGTSILLGSTNIITAAPSGSAGGDLTGTYPSPTFVTVNSTPATYGSGSSIPVISVDNKGRSTLITTVNNTPSASSITGTLSVTSGGTGSGVQTTINATPINYGTSNIITASANTLTTTTLNPTVINSSLQALGTVAIGIWNATAIADAYISSSANWNTAYTNRITSLTTTGSSGASTLSSNTLNIPTYTATGIGAVPTSRLINTTSPITGGGDLSSDRTIALDQTANYTWSGVHTFTNTNGILVLQNGVSELSGLTGVLQDLEGTVNNFLAVNLRNQSNGNIASGDITVTADNGTNTTHYIDMGMNGSGYAQPSVSDIVGADGTYLYSQTDSMAIYTASNQPLILGTGGSLHANNRLVISGTGSIFHTALSTGIMHLSSTGLESSSVVVGGDLSSTIAIPSGATGTVAGLTAGNATTLATARSIYGNSFNGSANVTGNITTTGILMTGSSSGTLNVLPAASTTSYTWITPSAIAASTGYALTVSAISGSSVTTTWSAVASAGVTSIATNNGVTGGTITGTGTIGLASIAATSVLANTTGGSAAPSSALAYTTTGASSSLAEVDANSNLSANNFVGKWSTTATAGGTTTLTVSSSQEQNFTGSTTQVVVLPVASTLTVGFFFIISNQSTGSLTINSSGGNLVNTSGGGSTTIVKCILASGTNAASWQVQYAATNPTTLGQVTQYNGVSTAGWGIPAINGFGRVTAQTAAVASVSSYTVGAADGSFVVSANVNVTASTTHSFTVTCTYTNEQNNSVTLTEAFAQLTGSTLLTAITNVTGVGSYEGISFHIRAKAGTAITWATTGTFTSVTYNTEGLIEQIR